MSEVEDEDQTPAKDSKKFLPVTIVRRVVILMKKNLKKMTILKSHMVIPKKTVRFLGKAHQRMKIKAVKRNLVNQKNMVLLVTSKRILMNPYFQNLQMMK